MIIGIDGHMIGDHSGGNESFYSNILSSMKISRDDKIYLFLKDGVDASSYEDRFQIVRFASKSSFKRNFIELNRLCKKYKIELLHTQYFIPFIRSCDVVCTIHDICFEHYKNIFTKKEYIRQKILIPYAAKHSKYIFTVSNHAKQDIVNHYKVKSEKVIVTYNAVNKKFKKISANEINETEIRNKYGIGDDKFVLTVGNLQPRKNLPRLIEAYNDWQKDNGFGKLVIVGKKAWLYSEILQAAGAKSDNIILTDYVSEDDLIKLYNIATCFIYPSFFEGFGIPPLEAMACGTPVAVADATSLPEVVGNAGIYFDPFNVEEIKNAIDKLMTNNDLNEMIERGYKRAESFSWEDSARIILETYHNCNNR